MSFWKKSLRFAELETSTLRAMLAVYSLLEVLSAEREAIAHELAMREWAEHWAQHLDETISWCRGGRS